MARSTWASACAVQNESAPTLQPQALKRVSPRRRGKRSIEARLRMDWLPHAETFLGREAGKWLRQTIAVVAKKKRQERPLTWRQFSKTSPLLEMSCFLIDAQTWRAYTRRHRSQFRVHHQRTFEEVQKRSCEQSRILGTHGLVLAKAEKVCRPIRCELHCLHTTPVVIT